MSVRVLDISVSSLMEQARRPEVVQAMRDFYAEADREIAEQGATCWNRGECCRFGQYGHRLYVTTLEIVYYLTTGVLPPPATADACPHSLDGKCHARDRRPLGCRVFFCDAHAQQWQGPLSERRLTRLRAMHEQLNVPYCYVDWMTVLEALNARGT